eukprot:Gb_10113 [translate_table: standard]
MMTMKNFNPLIIFLRPLAAVEYSNIVQNPIFRPAALQVRDQNKMQMYVLVGHQNNDMGFGIRVSNLSTVALEAKTIENVQEEQVETVGYRGNEGNDNTSCKEGRLKEAEDILQLLNRRDVCPEPSTYTSLLQVCIETKSLAEGKRVHSNMIKTGFKPSNSIGNRLVDMYCKCGSLLDARQLFDKMPVRDVIAWTTMISGYIKSGSIGYARQLFDKMPERDVVSWNAMISGHVHHGHAEEVLKLFRQMRQKGMKPDPFTFTSVLGGCASLADQENGEQVHANTIITGAESCVSVGNALVDMYAKCGSIKEARGVFDRMPIQDLVSWTTIITGYLKCGSIEYARTMFDNMPEPYVVACNAMIAGYAQHGHNKDALKLFSRMYQAGMKLDYFTYTSVLSACANLSALEYGKQLHAYIIKTELESSVSVENALVSLYAKCGFIEDARLMFDKMPERDVISWNAMVTGYANRGSLQDAQQLFVQMPERNVLSWTSMIAGYAQHGHGELASKLFCQMKHGAMKPDHFTFASVLSACASLAVLEHGRQVHAQLIQIGFDSYVSVGNALVTMYARCGVIEDAYEVFDKMPELDVVSWNAMIAGFAQHGHGKEALQHFKQMLCAGMKPDRITFLCVLSACSHTGLVDEGRKYFDSMSRVHGITAGADHYARMIDLLGRAGCLDEAESLINNMPFEPDAGVWEALLGACRIHGNMDLGIRAAECLISLEPQRDATYVLLSNMYAAAGRWENVAKVRKAMKDKGVKKEPGCSWIEVKNRVHVFLVGDGSHPQALEIYATLDKLAVQMKKAGYVPDTGFVLHDVEHEYKEHVLSNHSEKLAIAFGLISTPHGTPIRIIKNLRVCGDCHTAIKFISKIVGREIILPRAVLPRPPRTPCPAPLPSAPHLDPPPSAPLPRASALRSRPRAPPEVVQWGAPPFVLGNSSAAGTDSDYYLGYKILIGHL